MEQSTSLPRIKPAGVRSPTVISLQLAGWLLFGCLWLPLCRGCEGSSDRIPIEKLQFNLSQLDKLFADIVLLAAYCNGLFIAFSICVAALLVSERFWKVCLITQFFLTNVLSIILIVFSIANCSTSRNLLETVLWCGPPLIGFFGWVSLALRSQEYLIAWARLQHVWTIVALVFVHLQIVLQGSVRYGYWVTLVALACEAIAVEFARCRMKHDLWDGKAPIVRPQFSIRKIMFWTAFFPIVFSYFRAIEPFCNWFFHGVD